MKLFKRLSLLLFMAGILSLNLTASGDTPADSTKTAAEKKEIVWHRYDDGLQLASKVNKHVFVDFTADWCGYCRKMEREVWTDPRVIDILNNDFVPVRVNGESKRELNIDGYKISERNLAVREFGVRGFPTFWFLKSDGTKLGPLGGYRPADFMVEALTWVKEERYDSTSTEDSDTSGKK